MNWHAVNGRRVYSVVSIAADCSRSTIARGEIMSSTTRDAPQVAEQPAASPSPALRVWPAVVIIAAFWLGDVALMQADIVISQAFMSRVGWWLLCSLVLVIYWLTRRQIRWSERLSAVAAAATGAGVCASVSPETLGTMNAIFFGFPLVWTAWVAWMLFARNASERTRRVGLLVCIALVWAGVSLVRVDGVDGNMLPGLHWRWTPTAEQLYLAEQKSADSTAPREESATPLVLEAGDWPCFRGPGFLGVQEHPPIATNWDESPPKLLWKRRVGPAWSSFVVIGDRLFTQEQRDQQEATVCLDAATGEEIWAHLDKARFWDGQAGAGPRGTPTFHDGRLYTYGATGLLDCLDATTGKLLWQRDVVKGTAAPMPMWGYSSSPLVVDGRVIVFAGGPDDKGIVAYDAESGGPAWHSASGPISYSTAQLVNVDGQAQALLLTDMGVVAVDPADGKRLWHYDANGSGIWRVVQPRQLDDSRLLVGSEDMGLRLLNVSREGDSWKTSEAWATGDMKPAYNDFVVVGDVAYGFDKGIFCSVDLATGKRLWKGGRYGYGQVLLLKPQNVLVILSERGEVALVAANPKKHEELGRFPAIEGKTWNHPVVVRGKLYVRNDAEMAAFELAASEN
jgi:outer membrane protein assembly factor BamB